MADLFASSKQPSLFPTTIPEPKISKEEYRTFYKDERALFRIFLELLHREVVESRLVMGFLLWLEREGYTSYSLGKLFLNSLTPDVINQVADEVVICINFLQKKANNFTSISHLQFFLDRKRIHLEDLHRNGDLIFYEVSCIANDISSKAFDDILEQFIRHDETQMTHSHREATATRSVGGLGYTGAVVGFQQAPADGVANRTKLKRSYQMTNPYQHQQIVGFASGAIRHDLVSRVTDIRQSKTFGDNQAYSSGRAFLNYRRSPEREPDEEVPPDDRTIFLTFSKGYPLSEYEITQYFTSMLGDFIESIHMQPVEPETQALFARLVVRHPSFVRAVIERDGPHGKSKYIINGKHVWARKFVPRPPYKESL